MQILFNEISRFAKELVDYIRFVKTPSLERTEKYPYFLLCFQDDEILSLAEAYEEVIPHTDENIVYKSKSFQTLPLFQAAGQIEALIHNSLPDCHFSISMTQQELAELKIWDFICEDIHSYSSPPWHFSYFEMILDRLGAVNFLQEVQLQAIELSAIEDKIYLDLEWHGPFDKIELQTIPNVPKQLWSVTGESQNPSLPIRIMRYFLYLQVAVIWSENRLIVNNLQKPGYLTMRIQIQKAVSQEPPIVAPMSESSLQNVSDYIVQQSYSKYNDISQKLEMKLSKELELCKMHSEQGRVEILHVHQIQKAIDSLVQYRKDYLDEITRLE